MLSPRDSPAGSYSGLAAEIEQVGQATHDNDAASKGMPTSIVEDAVTRARRWATRRFMAQTLLPGTRSVNRISAHEQSVRRRLDRRAIPGLTEPVGDEAHLLG